jgi:hypothetical protein
MSVFHDSRNLQPRFLLRLVLVFALAAMTVMAGGSPTVAGVNQAETLAHGVAAPTQPSNWAVYHNTYTDDIQSASIPHVFRVTGSNCQQEGENCCAAGCLMLGLPVDLLPTLSPGSRAAFLRPEPRFVASAASAHLRPPRA